MLFKFFLFHIIAEELQRKVVFMGFDPSYMLVAQVRFYCVDLSLIGFVED